MIHIVSSLKTIFLPSAPIWKIHREMDGTAHALDFVESRNATR